MSVGRDYSLVFQINKHYCELRDEFKGIKSINEFSSAGNARKAILLDLAQIGELINHLSKGFINDCDISNIRFAIDIRNVIVHAYGKVDDKRIYETIRDDFEPFIKQMNDVADQRYIKDLNNFVGKQIEVYIEEQIDENQYQGYCADLTTLSGGFQQVCIKMHSPKRVIKAKIDSIKMINNVPTLVGHE